MSFLNIEPNCGTSPVNGSYLCRNGEFEMVDHLARCQAENKLYIVSYIVFKTNSIIANIFSQMSGKKWYTQVSLFTTHNVCYVVCN